MLAAALRYPTPEGLDAIILDYSVHVQLDDSGKMHKTTRTVERIVRLQSIAGSRQAFAAWIPWRENRPKIKARVITSDGKPHLLDEASITENSISPASPGGSINMKALSADLPAVSIDSVVEVEIEESDRETTDPGGRWGEITVSSRYLIGHFSAVLETTSAHPLLVESRGFRDVKRSMSQTGSAQQVSIEDSDIMPGQSGILLPPDQTPVPTVIFSTAVSWQSVAQWYSSILSKVSLAAAPHTPTPSDQVAAMETVFNNIEKKVKSTGAPLGADPYTPQTPAETLNKGSGDPKDKAVLLISKLAEIGIPAKAALVRAGPASDVPSGVPGIDGFNRMLVYVPGQHPFWIDPGSDVTPVSRLPFVDQDRFALVVDPSTTDLVRTPASAASDNREISTTEIQLQDGSEAKVQVTFEARGAFEDLARTVYAPGKSQDEIDKLRSELAQISRVRRITKLDTGEAENLLTPYQLHFVAEGYSASAITDAAASVDLPGPASLGFRQLTPLLQATAQGYTPEQIVGTRKSDYYAPPAFTEDAHYHVMPPMGYRLSATPSISSITLGPLTLSSTVKAEADGSLRIDYSLINPKTRYTTQEMLALLRDFQKLRGQGTVRIVFTNVAEEKIASGQLKEGIALLRQSAASASSSSNASLRLANVYAQVGARAEGIKLCQDVLAKDPKNASAYARLGWIYTHDEFGRQFRAGMNMADAEKAYLKAIELDPDEKSYLLDLARLYTYNSAGIRYGRSARLDDALQKFREVGIENLGKYNALNEYALALLVSRRYDQVKQFFLFPQAEGANPAVKLAAIAATSGATDVKEEADFVAPGADKQKTLLLEAAQYLLTAREYQPAVTLFQMVRVPVKGASGIGLEKLQRARNFDESAASPQPGIAAFQRFVAAVLNPADPEEWKKHVVPEARDDSSSRYAFELIALVNGASTAESDMSTWPFISDVLTTGFNFVADGSDTAGFRIRVADSGTKNPKPIAYVVKRGSEYLVAGLAGTASSSGEALALAQKGDLAGARQWLDWAKEELPPATSADPIAGLAFARLWPPKAAATSDVVLAAAATLASRGKNYQNGVAVLQELRARVTDPDLQTAIDQGVAQSFLEHQKYADAIPVLEQLRSKWAKSEVATESLAVALIYDDQFPAATALIENSETAADPLEAMRLRERLLAQQQKFKDAAALEARICGNPKATAFDWNDLAWIGLFAQSDDKTIRDAAEKAAQLTQGRSTSVLQTLAVVQASTGMLEQARLNAYHLMDEAADSDELVTVFGRITEELDLRNIASEYYRRVKKPEGNATLSNYAFAQMRLNVR